MAFTSIHDPDFWGNSPEEVKAINQAAGNEGLTSSHYLLGRREDNPPLVAPLRMEPGYVLTRHAHDCFRLEIIIEGSLQVGDRTMKPGDIMMTEPGVLYGPHVAGPDGCVTFEICSDFEGANRFSIQDPSGKMITLDVLDPSHFDAIVGNANEQREKLARD
jgi:hypothetical protein